MFATELLKDDHQQVKDLFDRLEGEKGDAKKGICALIAHALEVHAQIEEDIFYVDVQEASELARPLVDLALQQHREIAERASELEALPVEDDEYDAKVAELKALVLQHVALEEARIFPEALRAIDDAELERMAEDMRREMKELTERKLAALGVTEAAAGL